MDNTVNKFDTTAKPGSAIGVQSIDKINSNVIIYPQDKDVKTVGARIVGALENSVTAFTDDHRSPKYTVDADAAYYGSGALSLLPRLGKLVFAKSLNDANRAAFRLNQTDSTFYSSADQTTIGSTNVDTLDGWILNPLSLIFPSSNFTPTKPWVKKLFPTLSSNSLTMIAVLELVQVALLNALFGETQDYRTTKDRKDLGAIILDNQEIEDKLFQMSQQA